MRRVSSAAGWLGPAFAILALAVEIVELKRFAVAIVKGVLAITGMRHDDEPVALEAPFDAPTKSEAILKEIERVLKRSPDIHLAEFG